MQDSTTPIPWLTSPEEGFVTSTTRRWIFFADDHGTVRQGTAATKALDITVGDRIHFQKSAEQFLIDDYQERKNCLYRQVGKKRKLLSANLDLVCIVTAVGKLFQPIFVDRVLCIATHEEIRPVIVVNKIDLEIDDETSELITVYQDLGIEVLLTSTREEGGLAPVYDLLQSAPYQVVSLVGVSGVGKSSLLNELVPQASRWTREVSEKSGLGRQTTTQAEAFHYHDALGTNLFLVDLPGIQQFGISQFSIRDVQHGMPDIEALGAACEYADCQHIAEPHCAVKAGVESGLLAITRFQSYLGMLEEIDRSKEY
ncbi:MAG: ribosome small subunit-dependent GTPase A [Bdellovibrionales bacterium]|nr:ribosome small subunit-dependent GTPase A [Bdellovibrionales bacterium]